MGRSSGLSGRAELVGSSDNLPDPTLAAALGIEQGNGPVGTPDRRRRFV